MQISKFLVYPDTSVRKVMTCIDRNGKGIALVVDGEHHLIGTVTDGDIRRAILANMDLNLPVQRLPEYSTLKKYFNPLTAPVGTSDADLLQMMKDDGRTQIPIIDDDGRVVDIAVLDELVKEYELPLTAVIMAGGYGNRLQPLTEKVPKPMLLVGDRPLMELTIEQLRQAGIRRVHLATHHRREIIENHFGDGQNFGVEIKYVKEDQPLGTAGALSLLEASNEPLLVINGDILTRVDFGSMLTYHREQNADMTVAVRQYDVDVPYGVLECEGHTIRQIQEKPTYNFFVNAGIYLLDPSVRQYIPHRQNFDMPDLIKKLIEEKRSIVSFPIVEYWLDIGRHSDYIKAQEDIKNGRFSS